MHNRQSSVVGARGTDGVNRLDERLAMSLRDADDNSIANNFFMVRFQESYVEVNTIQKTLNRWRGIKFSSSI